MATTSDDKCAVCARDCDDIVCELCEEVSYCGDTCEAVHFMSHRSLCKFKERNLKMQEVCAVCSSTFSDTHVPPVACKICWGIKYCSEQCRRGNEVEHKILCKAYTRLPVRPTIDHRLHIFFPANEAEPRFIWLERTLPSYKAVISPKRGVESYSGNCEDEAFKVEVLHQTAFLSSGNSGPNHSLGKAARLPPLRSMKGNVLLCILEPCKIVEDISPSSLPKLLASLREREYDWKMSHSPRSGWPQSALNY